jgi:hypothetical protein
MQSHQVSPFWATFTDESPCRWYVGVCSVAATRPSTMRVVRASHLNTEYTIHTTPTRPLVAPRPLGCKSCLLHHFPHRRAHQHADGSIHCSDDRHSRMIPSAQPRLQRRATIPHAAPSVVGSSGGGGARAEKGGMWGDDGDAADSGRVQVDAQRAARGQGARCVADGGHRSDVGDRLARHRGGGVRGGG